MNDHSEQTTTAQVASWQQWSVWLARTGYSDLELSTVMTLQHINRAKIEKSERTPAKVYAAALEVENSWDAVEQFEVAQPFMLICADDATSSSRD